MRIDAVIIEGELTFAERLRKCLAEKFPEIRVQGEAKTFFEAGRLIKAVNPSLIFCDNDTLPNYRLMGLRDRSKIGFEVVLISGNSNDALLAFRQEACGFLLKPFDIGDIVLSVTLAIQKISEKNSSYDHLKVNQILSHSNLVGIPCIDGIEFLNTCEIVRCEGLQKCTRIITVRESNIVSSYNIGEFRRVLNSRGFFSCHKSHLINLVYVRKLTKEGFIILADKSAVPLARRKRQEFLQSLDHL